MSKRLPLIPRERAARLLGLSVRAFERVEAAGAVKAVQPGGPRRPALYDPEAIAASYVAHIRRKHGKETARDRRDRSQAELNELHLERARAKLSPRDQVVPQGRLFIRAVRAGVERLRRRVMRSGHIAPASEGMVRELLEDTIRDLGPWENELGLLEAGDAKAWP